MTQSERNEIANDVAPQLAELTRLRVLIDEYFESTSLLALVNDSDSFVRYEVAKEEHCPEDVLIELVKDDDDGVRDAAYRKMRHLVYRKLFY